MNKLDRVIEFNFSLEIWNTHILINMYLPGAEELRMWYLTEFFIRDNLYKNLLHIN